MNPSAFYSLSAAGAFRSPCRPRPPSSAEDLAQRAAATWSRRSELHALPQPEPLPQPDIASNLAAWTALLERLAIFSRRLRSAVPDAAPDVDALDDMIAVAAEWLAHGVSFPMDDEPPAPWTIGNSRRLTAHQSVVQA